MSEDKKYVEEMEPESTDTEVNETMSLELDKTIQTYEKKLSDYDEKLQRALADYQNLERRTKVEISQRVSDKINSLLLNFINIYEDFIRAENALSKENVDINGINAVIKNMENLLAENNIKPIDAVGEIFDPQIQILLQNKALHSEPRELLLLLI